MKGSNGVDFLTVLILKWLILKNKLFSIKKESRLKVIVILLFILFYGVGSFLFLLSGFDYINSAMGVGYILVDRLFYVFFMVLFVMLTTSQLIITYSSFYANREVEYLFSLPVRRSSIFGVKFLESTFLSSWAFMFLSLPVFMAYGAGRSLSLNFYLTGMILSLCFICICASVGTSIGVLLVRYFSKKYLKILIALGIITASALFLYYKKARQEFNWQTGDLGLILDHLLKNTNISLYPLLPSYWISKGLLNVVSKDWSTVLFYFLMLLSSAVFFVWLCLRIGDSMYFTGWQALKAGQKTKQYFPRKYNIPLDKWRMWALISKDMKLFRRDPVQWSQFAIFFGIIGIYIFNLRSMRYDIDSIFWKNLLSFLNIGTIALTLGTLCTRFVYPQMSIECKRLWIIGLTPVSIGKVLFIKYAVSVFFCLIITVGLMIGSNIMIKAPEYIVWLSIVTMFVMSIALPGLALGLGAVFPNLKEDDLAKIVSGFGGTLTLVLSLTYIAFILALEVIPVHLYYTKQVIEYSQYIKYMVIACGAGVILSIITTTVPMVWGHRSLNRLEM